MLNQKKLDTKMLEAIPRIYDEAFTGTWTINSSGYVQLGTMLTGKAILSAYVKTWTSNTGAFSLVFSGNTAYLVGTPNTQVKNPEIRITYI